MAYSSLQVAQGGEGAGGGPAKGHLHSAPAGSCSGGLRGQLFPSFHRRWKAKFVTGWSQFGNVSSLGNTEPAFYTCLGCPQASGSQLLAQEFSVHEHPSHPCRNLPLKILKDLDEARNTKKSPAQSGPGAS